MGTVLQSQDCNSIRHTPVAYNSCYKRWATLDQHQNLTLGMGRRCIAHDSSKHSAAALVKEQTPGGLNEECIQRLTDGGVYTQVR